MMVRLLCNWCFGDVRVIFGEPRCLQCGRSRDTRPPTSIEKRESKRKFTPPRYANPPDYNK